MGASDAWGWPGPSPEKASTGAPCSASGPLVGSDSAGRRTGGPEWSLQARRFIVRPPLSPQLEGSPSAVCCDCRREAVDAGPRAAAAGFPAAFVKTARPGGFLDLAGPALREVDAEGSSETCVCLPGALRLSVSTAGATADLATMSPTRSLDDAAGTLPAVLAALEERVEASCDAGGLLVDVEASPGELGRRRFLACLAMVLSGPPQQGAAAGLACPRQLHTPCSRTLTCKDQFSHRA